MNSEERLRRLEASVAGDINGKSCLMKNGKISPFLNPPHDGLRPGAISEEAYRLHELYPEVFSGKTSFMGAEYKDNAGGQDQMRVASEEVFVNEGEFDEAGNFKAPIAVYRGEYIKPFYILFQQGSYQALPESQGENLEKGKILLHRGLRNRKVRDFREPEIDSDGKEDYMDYLALSFMSPVLSLPYNAVSKGSTDHVKVYKTQIRSEAGKMNRAFMKQSYTSEEDLARGKFGPNFVSVETPLDNVRVLTQWTGEWEFHLLDPERVNFIDPQKAINL